MGGSLGVNFFPPTATSGVAGPPRTGLFLIAVGVIRVEWVTLTYISMFCSSACGVGCRMSDCVVQVLTLLCVILYYYLLPSLSLRLLLLSIAVGAVD